MKKLLILSLSISLISLSARPIHDSVKTTDKIVQNLELTPVATDTLLDTMAVSVIKAHEFNTPRTDSLIVQNADIIVRAVASVIPGLAPFTHIIGMACTGLGFLIIGIKWRIRKRREREAGKK